MIMEQKLCATCVALAVFALAMAIPQGTALARGGMEVRTADLCLVDDAKATGLPEYDSEAIGTVAAVTDRRFGVTAWAVSLEGMLHSVPGTQPVYHVYDTGQNPEGPDCEGDEEGTFFVYKIYTDENGEAFQNTESVNPTSTPDVGDVIQICRYDDDIGGDIPILKGVLVKGGKEKNKPNRC